MPASLRSRMRRLLLCGALVTVAALATAASASAAPPVLVGVAQGIPVSNMQLVVFSCTASDAFAVSVTITTCNVNGLGNVGATCPGVACTRGNSVFVPRGTYTFCISAYATHLDSTSPGPNSFCKASDARGTTIILRG